MTPERLAEIKARCEVATPGPWIHTAAEGGWDCVVDLHGGIVFQPSLNHPPNYTFAAHARQDIPDLVAEVERLQAELREARDFCRSILDAEADDDARTIG